jgi:IPT/TIG domain
MRSARGCGEDRWGRQGSAGAGAPECVAGRVAGRVAGWGCGRVSGRGFWRAAWIAWLALAVGVPAWAEGPRWVTGPPYFTTGPIPVKWYTMSPLYFTDPGDLSASVDHAAADTLVAAAAAMWNVPTAAMVLAQGGELAEHVSGANTFLGVNGPVFPADVSASNFAAIQIAVIYDSDGSVTDLLLGQGASAPAECRQTGVTESVDSITPAGLIDHAMLIVNGRCTGPAPEQQTQLEYQMARAFGRILGLGWAQTNDNLFTGAPAPTSAEALDWPLMHPIDVLCGLYTYQCMADGFGLRIDDIGSISSLYPIAAGAAAAGKVASLTAAGVIAGFMLFPTGQGIQGMNVEARRHLADTNFIDGPVASAVTGMLYRWNNGNVVTGALTTQAASYGQMDPEFEGQFTMGWVPVFPGQALDDVLLVTEAINPLYTGEYTVGPYMAGQMELPAPAFAWEYDGVAAFGDRIKTEPVPGTPAVCSAAGQGTATVPVAVPASGWWTNMLCGTGTLVAWPLLQVAANRSFTVEVTGLDGSGNATTAGVEPLVGIWNKTDSTGVLPTVAATPVPFNSVSLGLTTVTATVTAASTLRMAIEDVRGNGRPDYVFRARVLYAASILPATVPAGGGIVTITGMGFRTGNAVTVNGVEANVLGWTPTAIIAVVPPFASLGAGSSTQVDVQVTDLTTGGTTVMSGALGYPAAAAPTQAESMLAVTPVVYVAAGETVPVVEQVAASAGGAVSPGVSVSWTVTAGAMVLPDAGGVGPVVTTTDGNGLSGVTATVGPLTGGAQAVGSACAWTSVCGSFAAVGVDPSLWTPGVVTGGGQMVAAGGVLLPLVVQVTDGAGHAVIGAPVTIYQTVTPYEVCPAEGRCAVAPVIGSSTTAAVSDGNGLVTVTPLEVGAEAEVTNVAVSTGTQGFLTVVLVRQ